MATNTSTDTANPDGLVSAHDLCIIIMGPTGSGKTSLLGTMAKRGFVLNTWPYEKGAWIRLKPFEDRITIRNLREWRELDDIYDQLKRPGSYDWFALDSVTGLGELALERTIGDRIKGGFNLPRERVTQNDWGTVGKFVRDALISFERLPMPKIFITQERRYTEEGLDNQIGPNTRPAVLGYLLQVANGIGRIYSVPVGSGKFERRMLTVQHPNYMTKWQVYPDREESWPAVIRNPNLQQMLGYAYGPKGKYPPPEGVQEDDPQELQTL